MSEVLRNLGELASPYYLLELWVRRYEIDLDPETYASLKRKTRGLVRDALAFDHRGETVDPGWRSARREVLGLNGSLDRRSVALEAGSIDIALAATGPGAPRLLVGELDPNLEPEHRDEAGGWPEPPATMFELALEAAERDVLWGLLLCGVEARVYRRGTGISQQYLALDLDGLVSINDEELWKAFAGLFRLPAFRPDRDGVPLIQRVCDESRAHASELAKDMRGDVVFAAETLIQGALDEPANEPLLGSPPPDGMLRRLFEDTLYVLYRLLFILYAESRDVLPLSAGGPYATTYSLDHLIERARRRAEPPPGVTYTAETIAGLFHLLADGPPELAGKLGIPVLGGELFASERTELFDRLRVSERAWRQALLALAVGEPGSARARLGRRSSFAELGVDQLGSIYEGLLVLEPRLVSEPSALVGSRHEPRVLAREVTGEARVARELPTGTFVLESSSGRRKGSGSFYTPHEITEFLAGAALDPLVDPLVQRALDRDPNSAERELLALTVCDPAMGSGAFLVQAARVLGRALARIRAARRATSVTPKAVKQAEAEVVRRCLYGVDLNPLAVTLAKVSLWLETLQVDHPLTFLDAHLRVGDSLVGVELRGGDGGLSLGELTSWPRDAADGLKDYLRKVPGEDGQPMLTALKGRKALPKNRQAPLPGMGAHELSAAIAQLVAEREGLTGRPEEQVGDLFQLELDVEARFRALERDEHALRNRLRHAADVWAAQWFWPGDPGELDAFDHGSTSGVIAPPGEAAFHQLIAYCLDPSKPLQDEDRETLEVALDVARERHFFHWALEFPEVIVDRGGFDAVIGNPPWNTLSPDVKEFFSTFDPLVFRRGVTKAKQDERRRALLEDPAIRRRWREEARRLYQLGAYLKPKARRYTWFPEDGQLRKGDANVFRQFVERAYRLLRPAGRMAQVLPDSVYVSSPTTELRRRLLEDARLDFCFVFENRRLLFPIDSRIKIVLLGATACSGPTSDFAAAFITGKDAAGADRAIGLPELPATLAALQQHSARLTREQIRALSPQTLAFPELVTPLDAEIAVAIAARHPPLNLDERGWGLTYCRELDAEKDSWRFKTADQLTELGATRDGLYWRGPDGQEWWPLIEGTLFYHLEFPMEGKEPKYWVDGTEVAAIPGRFNPDGTSVMQNLRAAWRDVSRSVDERSTIAALLPPRTAAKDKAPTVWGGSRSDSSMRRVTGLMSSFVFDYLIRFKGVTSLKYGQINSAPAPPEDALSGVADEIGALDHSAGGWAVGERRAQIDALVAAAYGLTLREYAAVLSSFPLLDRAQPMLPGEPKSFVTRDLALLAYARHLGDESPDIVVLLEAAGIELTRPHEGLRRLDSRVEAHRELGAVPYRPTPKGGRPPTDPALIEAVGDVLAEEPQTLDAIAEAVEEDEAVVKKVLERLVKEDGCFVQGRGAARSYYLLANE